MSSGSSTTHNQFWGCLSPKKCCCILWKLGEAHDPPCPKWLSNSKQPREGVIHQGVSSPRSWINEGVMTPICIGYQWAFLTNRFSKGVFVKDTIAQDFYGSILWGCGELATPLLTIKPVGEYSTTFVQYLYISCYLSDNKPVLSYLLLASTVVTPIRLYPLHCTLYCCTLTPTLTRRQSSALVALSPAFVSYFCFKFRSVHSIGYNFHSTFRLRFRSEINSFFPNSVFCWK